MTEFTLTMLDTSGIQGYIFNSNRLQENIGASELVYRATTLWAFWAFKEAGLTHNIIHPDELTWFYSKEPGIENDPALDAEVVYAGGGNTLIIFRRGAKDFTYHLTRRVLAEAPGLELVVQHKTFPWDDEHLNDLRAAQDDLMNQLAMHKQARQPSLPTLGIGVSAICQSTGLPAVQTNENLKASREEETRLVSREIAKKLVPGRNWANQRLALWLSQAADGFEFPYEIDHLGRIKGEESYVAVVHADGNKMGEHLLQATKLAPDNREFIRTLRQFSLDVNEASLMALKEVVGLIAKATRRKEDGIPHVKNYLPFRPLVFGGDDVTFLCNGQIGVSLAAAYLEAFERATQKRDRKDMHACAGVAIVKMHYPFARAYKLSEELTGSAKGFVRREANADCSALDWHYATSGLSGDLDVIRRREYQVAFDDNNREVDGLMTMRPVFLRNNATNLPGRYWREGLERLILDFKYATYWTRRRNKVIGLREPLRKGPDALQTYRRNFDIQPLPSLGKGEAIETGWQEEPTQNGKKCKRCVYFDAVELFDHYIPLSMQEVK